jgi:hypothetical protein
MIMISPVNGACKDSSPSSHYDGFTSVKSTYDDSDSYAITQAVPFVVTVTIPHMIQDEDLSAVLRDDDNYEDDDDGLRLDVATHA